MPAKKKAASKKTIENKLYTALEGLAIAMQTEVEGYEFYKVAAKNSKDPGAKQMFESLAKDEKEHYEMLARHQEHLVENGTHKPLVKPPKAKLNAKSPVFTKEFLSSKRKKNFEMSALSIGVMLEMNAIEFFREQHEKSADPKARKLFQYLIDWEGEHLRALIAQRNFLMRGIFEDARFEPF